MVYIWELHFDYFIFPTTTYKSLSFCHLPSLRSDSGCSVFDLQAFFPVWLSGFDSKFAPFQSTWITPTTHITEINRVTFIVCSPLHSTFSTHIQPFPRRGRSRSEIGCCWNKGSDFVLCVITSKFFCQLKYWSLYMFTLSCNLNSRVKLLSSFFVGSAGNDRPDSTI